MAGIGAGYWKVEGRVEELKKLLGAGLSATQIARALTLKFRASITRNAIIGKVARLGLKLPNSSSKRKRPKAAERRSPLKGIVPPKPKTALRRALEMAPEPLPESTPDDIARISFAELESHLCHWIPGNPSEGDALTTKKYCGLPIVHGAPSPYCLGHLKRAFRPLEEQPRDFRRQFANDNASKDSSNPMPVKQMEKV